MGGCLVAILALLTPRMVMVFVWLLTDWFSRAYDTVIWPLLGFVFLPYTTLAYMGAMLHGGLKGVWLVLFVLAILADLGTFSSSGRSVHIRRRRRRSS